jgi:SanA protein
MNFSKTHAKRILAMALLAALVIGILIPPIIVYSNKYHIYKEVDDVLPTDVAIVFGAGVRPDKSPSPMLRDRLITAVELYNAGKIETILVSGDNSEEHYNEPKAMQVFLMDNGVPESAIVMDFAGRRTYDTCYRAKEIFEVDNALLITQGYHLPRALYLCNTFGVASAGISATRQAYAGDIDYKIREILALYNSVLDVSLLHPEPILGEKEPIE